MRMKWNPFAVFRGKRNLEDILPPKEDPSAGTYIIRSLFSSKLIIRLLDFDDANPTNSVKSKRLHTSNGKKTRNNSD
jgi:hypothetical protein